MPYPSDSLFPGELYPQAAEAPAPRAAGAGVPKFKVPFAFRGSGFATVEQDSDDEVAQCVYAILATPLGSRLEDPEFGVEDPTFEQVPVNLDEWRAAIAEHEPRAEISTEQDLVDLVDEVKVRVSAA